MFRLVKGTLLGALVVVLGMGSAGCGGETDKPVTKQDEDARKAAGMEKYNKRQQEIAEQRKAAAEANKGKTDADKDKDKEDKKDKDKD